MSLDDPRDDVLAHVAGTIGIIGSLLALRAIFRIEAVEESEAFAGEQQRGSKPPERRSVLVENRKLNGVPLREIPGLREMGVTVSRVRSVGAIEVQRASAEIPLHVVTSS